MVNPALAQHLAEAAAAGSGGLKSDLEGRARQSRLTFAATIEAMKSGCTCQPCQWLRQAVDMLLEDVRTEVKDDASRVDPPPG